MKDCGSDGLTPTGAKTSHGCAADKVLRRRIGKYWQKQRPGSLGYRCDYVRVRIRRVYIHLRLLPVPRWASPRVTLRAATVRHSGGLSGR